mmetsp:Transcript_17393/g.22610  ORF Transcript_17393/g.22610 Transcript_17393/m.22610 type:complete len:595 (+) Transcript_17393:49-1833(+)
MSSQQQHPSSSGAGAVVVDPETVILLLQALSQQQQQQANIQQLKETAKPNVIMDILAPFLFLPPPTTTTTTSTCFLSNEDALSSLICLVSNDPATFLKPASRSVRNTACRISGAVSTAEHQQQQQTTMVVSPNLLLVITAQILGADVEVSTNATDAIIACCRKIGTPLIEPAFQAITNAWKQAWQGLKLKQNGNSIASTLCVRCASVVVDLILALDNDNGTTMAVAQDQTEALSLFLEMLHDESDPLVQMSMLDLMEKLASHYPVHHQRAKWLFSNPVLKPLLIMAGGMTVADDNDDDNGGEPDPILGGPALRVVAALCKIAGGQQQQQQQQDSANGVVGFQGMTDDDDDNDDDSSFCLKSFFFALQKFDTHSELDRLAVVDAISSFSMASMNALDMVLNHAHTRHAWLSLNVAQSKLKAAILMSIAMVLKHSYTKSNNDITTAGGMDMDMDIDDDAAAAAAGDILKKQLYVMLGSVNGSNQDTTDITLILTRSPFPEVRLGAYELLSTVATHISTGAQILLQNSQFFTFLFGNENENNEPTKEDREAKYGIVQAIYHSNAKGLMADAIVKQLETLIQRGPHYVQVQTWELATE